MKYRTESQRLKAVTKDGYLINDIINCGHTPSEQVQLAAVNRDGYAIVYIKNPSEEVQLAAIRNNHSSVVYIKKPSKQAIMLAVEMGFNPDAEFLCKLSDELIAEILDIMKIKNIMES